MNDLDYPEARDGLWHLLLDTVHENQPLTLFFQLSIDYADSAPAALIYTTGGTEGYVDRVDQCTVEVYAPGEQAVKVAESIRKTITHREGVEVPGVGYFDSIVPDVTPHDVPYADERVNLARATYRVTSRPL